MIESIMDLIGSRLEFVAIIYILFFLAIVKFFKGTKM